jgi:hypothetical protein
LKLGSNGIAIARSGSDIELGQFSAWIRPLASGRHYGKVISLGHWHERTPDIRPTQSNEVTQAL